MCAVTGTPIPAIRWTRDGKMIEEEEGRVSFTMERNGAADRTDQLFFLNFFLITNNDYSGDSM